MKKISFFYRDFGALSGAVAQRGNHFADAVLQNGAHEDVELLIYCANLGDTPRQARLRAQTVFSLNQDNRAGFLARALDELLIGLHVGLKSVFRRSDLFVISTPPYISGLVIALFQIFFRRQFAIDVRDMYPLAYLDAGLIRDGGVLHRIFNGLNRFIFKRAAFIVCATQGQADDISALVENIAPTTIYNGFPESFLDIERPERSGFRVVTHGTLGVYQNVEFSLALAQSLAEDKVEFVFIGQGSKADLVAKASGANVSYLGELPFSRVVEQVAACDVGLCVRNDAPQSRYSFPVKAWEYIGLKMPTLIYPPCEVSDVFPNMNGLHSFHALDVEKFKAVILQFKADKEKNGAAGLALRDETLSAFTRQALAKKFAELVFNNLGKR